MIIVTGASRGIGAAIAQRLSEAGHEILGIARTDLDSGIEIRKADVSNFSELKIIAKELHSRKIEVTGLVNAAGIASLNMAVLTPPEKVESIIGVNLVGTIFACQAFSPLMIRAKFGSIINFSSIAVSLGLSGESVYAASKAGVENFSRTFAREMSGYGIRINCISPGPIDTALLKGVTEVQIANIIKNQIIQKKFTPSDICDLSEFLLSEKSASLSGEVLHVGGV
jgi:3-oxoacyl-[acyl-carrier protein] reductase